MTPEEAGHEAPVLAWSSARTFRAIVRPSEAGKSADLAHAALAQQSDQLGTSLKFRPPAYPPLTPLTVP